MNDPDLLLRVITSLVTALSTKEGDVALVKKQASEISDPECPAFAAKIYQLSAIAHSIDLVDNDIGLIKNQLRNLLNSVLKETLTIVAAAYEQAMLTNFAIDAANSMGEELDVLKKEHKSIRDAVDVVLDVHHTDDTYLFDGDKIIGVSSDLLEAMNKLNGVA